MRVSSQLYPSLASVQRRYGSCCVASAVRVSAPVKPYEGIRCGGGLGTHDRGEVGEIAWFISDIWTSESRPMAMPPVELIKWCVEYMLGIISTKSHSFCCFARRVTRSK